VLVHRDHFRHLFRAFIRIQRPARVPDASSVFISTHHTARGARAASIAPRHARASAARASANDCI
jgi:hypothetical protein